MSDRNGYDGTDHMRRRHPAVDRGHQVLRDTQGGGYPPSPYGDSGSFSPSFIENGFDGIDDPRSRRDQTGRRAARPAQDPRAAQAYPAEPYGGAEAYPPDPYAADQTGERRAAPDSSRLAAGRRANRTGRPEPRAARGGYEEPSYGGQGYDAKGYDAQGYGGQGYDNQGYDKQGYDNQGYDKQGYDGQGYNGQGYDGQGYNGQGVNGQGYDNQAYDGQGYNTQGYNTQGYNTQGYDAQGYDAQGYDAQGYDAQGYDRQGYPNQGYADQGYANQGYANQGYDNAGYGGDYPPAANGYDGGYENTGGYDNAGGYGGGRGTRGGVYGGGNGYDNYDDVADAVGAETPRRRGRSAVTLAIVVVLFAAVAGIGFGGYKYYQGHFTTPDYSGMGTGTVAVTVNKGDTATIIADTLYKDGVVKSTKAFIKAAIANPNSEKIEVGTYALHKQMSAVNALNMMLQIGKDGQPLYMVNDKVTIVEGELSFDIYPALAKASGLPVSDFVAAAKNPEALGVSSAWFTAKRNDGRKSVTSIEGFLYPATYNVEPGQSAKQILSMIVAQFNTVTGPKGLNFIANAPRTGATPYEALIAASIAQKEASTKQDMAGVTQVLYNRVFKSFPCNCLGVDSAVNYYLRSTGKSAEVSQQLTNSQLHNLKDPYNTRDVSGFTPGAISNPGSDALTGAIHPDTSKSSYFYFQTVGTSPKVVFAKTYSQFLAQQH